MRIYDVTLPLCDGMPGYPGDPPFRRRTVSTIEAGDASEVGVIETGCHAGTHIDAPAHLIRGGRRLDDIPLKMLVGPARVFDLSRIAGHIGAKRLARLPWRGVRRALFRTRNSGCCARAETFDPGFVAFADDVAEFLAEKKLLLVGIDGPSVDPFGSGALPVHRALFAANVAVVENLNLEGVPAGTYTLFCGPMKIAGGEGAPARVLLTRP